MYRIPLRVNGVDLDDDATCALIARSLAGMSWGEESGRVLATLYVDCPDPVGPVMQAVRSIRHHLNADVAEVDQDFVNISDIGHRVGVTRETVRNWVEGRRGPGDFPLQVGSAGSGERGPQKLWRWADISSWLNTHFGLGDEEDHLNPRQLAEVNAYIQGVRESLDREWETVSGAVYERELRLEPGSPPPVNVREGLSDHLVAVIWKAFNSASIVVSNHDVTSEFHISHMQWSSK